MPRRNSEHEQTRDLLRVVGPLVFGTGVVFTAIGFLATPVCCSFLSFSLLALRVASIHGGTSDPDLLTI